MRVFQASIEQMLWPERRETDTLFAISTSRCRRRHHPSHDRGQLIRVPSGYVPAALRPLLGIGARWFPFSSATASRRSARFPKGSPVSLLANVDLWSRPADAEQKAAPTRS